MTPEALFPTGHPLARLVRPTFESLRRAFADMFVATIWIDADEDPRRAGFRPSYDSVMGPGSSTMMPFVAAWLSAKSEGGSNVVLFPDKMDATLVEYATEIGLLGAFEWVGGVKGMLERVRSDSTRRRLYNIDDLDPAFDEHAVIGSSLSRWLNSKEDLASVTRFAPPERVKDMYDVTLAEYEWATELGSGPRVFLKTCNTENAGKGVFIANDAKEFELNLAEIRNAQKTFQLSRRLVVQPEIRGDNKSFQVLLDPRAPNAVQVVALSDQLVEADGKTYRSSVNHPITAETVEPVGAAILDMVDHIWERHPEAFGFLMSDYFQTERGPVLYDPGIRPTGNTATAMAGHLARAVTGRFHATSLVPFPTGEAGLSFGEFARRAPELFRPESLPSRKIAAMPWGWNRVQGFGMLIAIAEDSAGLDRVRTELATLARR